MNARRTDELPPGGIEALIEVGGIASAPDRRGAPLPLPGLPGLPGHPLLRPDSPVMATAATRLAGYGSYGSFRCPYRGAAGRAHVRITVVACPAQPYRDLRAVVLVSEPNDPAGLTPRELEVLGLLVDG